MSRPLHRTWFHDPKNIQRRSQWPRGLRRRSAAVRLLGLWVRISPEAWMSVCCECCVWSGRGLCDELITSPEESYRLVRRCVWSRNFVNEEALGHWGAVAPKTNKQTILSNEEHILYSYKFCNFLHILISHLGNLKPEFDVICLSLNSMTCAVVCFTTPGLVIGCDSIRTCFLVQPVLNDTESCLTQSPDTSVQKKMFSR